MTDAVTLAALFRVPLEEFTAARNRLVAEIRRAGRAPAAAAIARWVVRKFRGDSGSTS